MQKSLCSVSIFIASLVTSISSMACDPAIRSFPRDCAIQDRYEQIKDKLKAANTDINEIAEYRTIRFIGRSAWNTAKLHKTNITQIYKPAPETWEVWDHGMRALFGKSEFKGALFTGFNLNEVTLASMNFVLLTNGSINVKDMQITDQELEPGQYRKSTSIGIGFCAESKVDENTLRRADESLARFQERWEAASGQSLQQVVEDINGINATEQPTITTGMRMSTPGCNKFDSASHSIVYTPSKTVESRMKWITAFIQVNLQLFAIGKAVISPIEFASLVQKWFITTHPFADGNGRTSRALQDVLLANVGMPFAPAGDLQDDAISELEAYTDLTYQKIEQMLTSLENCANEIRSRNVSFQCKTVTAIIDQDKMRSDSGTYNN